MTGVQTCALPISAASNAEAKDGDAPKDDKVVDADFEVVDEDKK